MDTQSDTDYLNREPLVIERALEKVAIVLTLIALAVYVAPVITG